MGNSHGHHRRHIQQRKKKEGSGLKSVLVQEQALGKGRDVTILSNTILPLCVFVCVYRIGKCHKFGKLCTETFCDLRETETERSSYKGLSVFLSSSFLHLSVYIKIYQNCEKNKVLFPTESTYEHRQKRNINYINFYVSC